MSPHLDGPVDRGSVRAARRQPSAERAPEAEQPGATRASATAVGAVDEVTPLLTEELTSVLTDELRHEIRQRLSLVETLQRRAGCSEAEAHRYAQAVLELRAWTHQVHLAIHALASEEPPARPGLHDP